MSETAREYKINIDPRILELLGPSLYTNIYYILAELIANAYDADAANVYIIQKDDQIIVEDDGTGMSYTQGDIKRYLDVAVETRTATENVYSSSGRRKRMGRKGVGKLAALSVSKNVHVMTKKDGEVSGFILSRQVNADHKLIPLEGDQIIFQRITEKGTSIVMTDPQYKLHMTTAAIKRNLLKIFPLISPEFKVHIITAADSVTVDNFNSEMIKELGGAIILGENFHYLSEHFNSDSPDFIQLQGNKSQILRLTNKADEQKEYELRIEGWIGVYRSTRGKKADTTDFPDNFISLLSNKKLGEFNILPIVGKNYLNEVFVVGQLHIDLFEETELPDMALSNRQGYKSDDERYQAVIKYVRDDLLPAILNIRVEYAGLKKKERDRQRDEEQKRKEGELRQKVDDFKTAASEGAAKEIARKMPSSDAINVQEIIKAQMNEMMPIVGLKQQIDFQKKKVLISHTLADKGLADVVYKMLTFNNISDDEIIYTSCESEACRVPENASIFDYLRTFFVDSYSSQKIYVVFVTSDAMATSWPAVSEVGAVWITKNTHKIFNIENHKPKKPLNVEAEWHNSTVSGDEISMSGVEYDKFVIKIRDICNDLGCEPKDKEANKTELSRYVRVK
ncbi:MAG: ATP-binding protein [Kiritimatiellales bacterium]